MLANVNDCSINTIIWILVQIVLVILAAFILYKVYKKLTK